MGFSSTLTPSDRTRISNLSDNVIASTNTGSQVLRLPEGSSWRLMYGDAPDILGLRGGPLSRLVSIRQNVLREETLEIVLEYVPSDNIMGLVSRLPALLPIDVNISQDQLEQSVMLDCRQGGSEDIAGMLDLRLKGTH